MCVMSAVRSNDCRVVTFSERTNANSSTELILPQVFDVIMDAINNVVANAIIEDILTYLTRPRPVKLSPTKVGVDDWKSI